MGMSHVRQPAVYSYWPGCLHRRSRKTLFLPALSSSLVSFRNRIISNLLLSVRLNYCWKAPLNRSPRIQRPPLRAPAHTYLCICGCLCLFSNDFHISLILKGQKLLGSQQWADDSWLNMHLIPFGLVSVSKPPTFLSHNHSYRFSNQFRPPAWTEMTSDQHSPIVPLSKENVATGGCSVTAQSSPGGWKCGRKLCNSIQELQTVQHAE